MAIQLRRPNGMLPLWFKAARDELEQPIDNIDKKLAICSGVSFVLFLIFLALSV